MWQPWFVLAVLAATLILLISGFWRYDLVAVLALLALAFSGILPPGEVFRGFSNPAVITVAAVMVVGRALWNAGLIDAVSGFISRSVHHPRLQFMALTGVLTLCSTLVSDVGALSVFLPVATQLAQKNKQPLGRILMPLSFSAILGGIVTLIGTTPNILISDYRLKSTGHPFGFFAFTPVGGAVAIAGLVFLWLFSGILLPDRAMRGKPEIAEAPAYSAEVIVPGESPFVDRALGELEEEIDADFAVVGIIRDEERKPLNRYLRLRPADVLLVRAEPDDLKVFLDVSKMTLTGNQAVDGRFQVSDEMVLEQVVLLRDSGLIGQSARSIRLRQRYGINLLALSRHGSRLRGRLADMRLEAGDLLLLHGDRQVVNEMTARFHLLPLASRETRLVKPTRILSAFLIFALAIAAVASGRVSAPAAFLGAAALLVLTGHLTLREVYDSLEWPILILLGSFLSISLAFEKTGDAKAVAHLLLLLGQHWPLFALLGLFVAVSMVFSNFVNNAATAVIFAPIAIHVARGIGILPDPLLMAVAIGSSLPFWTPIGHQCNALVLTPGSYRFSDYWKLGLPLSLVTGAVAVFAILGVWSAHP